MPQHGGDRRPANPAPVSGPGSLSRRTDGGPADSQPIRRLPDAAHGESRDFEAQQAAAPVAQSQRVPVDTSGVVPLTAPSQRPDQPITEGAIEPGGPAAPDEFDIMRLRSWFPALKMVASRPNSSPATRQLVRQLEAYF